MAYAGICGRDNLQPHSDPYFSQRSQTEITAHITGAPTNFNEIQEFGLTDFGGTDGVQARLRRHRRPPRSPTAPTTPPPGIKAAIEAVDRRHRRRCPPLSANGFTARRTPAPRPDTTSSTRRSPRPRGSFTAVGGDYVKGGPSTNRGTAITTTNHNPTVTAPGWHKTIPIRTPFTLTGSATDSDGNTLIYLWEQNDPRHGQPALTNAPSTGPLFRVFGKYANVTAADTILYNSPGENLADDSPSRTFPDMEQVLADETNAEADLRAHHGDGLAAGQREARAATRSSCRTATYNLAGGAMTLPAHRA